jgi:hypothetical protein
MHFAYWITTAGDLHAEYVILIAFPRQQCLRERAAILRYMYLALLFLMHVLRILHSHTEVSFKAAYVRDPYQLNK